MSKELKLSDLDVETFVQLAATMSDRQIASIYGCAPPSIGRWRDRHGLPRSEVRPGRRPAGEGWGKPARRTRDNVQDRIDRHYFNRIDTPEKAYILGFLIADGHISKRGYRIEVGVKAPDESLLRSIADAVGFDAPLRTARNSYDGSLFRRISLCGRELVDDLSTLGLHHDKSTTAVYPPVSPDLEGHLVRGIWDGDGYIGKYQFELIGTSALLDGVCAAAERHTGCILRRRMSGKDGRYHYCYGTRRDTAILHWMYSGATIALDRKQEKFQTYWSEVPSAESLNLRIGLRIYTRKSQVRSAADYPC